MVELVFLVVLENLVVLVAKVFLEIRSDTQEARDPKASPETQASQAVVDWTELVEKMESQEVQGTVYRRVFLENLVALESKAPLVSPDQRVFRDIPAPEEQTGYLEVQDFLEDLVLKVCPALLVWTD